MYKITYTFANCTFVKFCFTMDQVDTWQIKHPHCDIVTVEELPNQPITSVIW